MPTYEYRCPKCDARVELFQSISERIAPNCFGDGCDLVVMETVIGSTTFVLHGSGWARDGYAGKK